MQDSLYTSKNQGAYIIISPSLRDWHNYIGLVGLLGVSLQLTLCSSCSVRYLRPQFGYHCEKCKTPSPCQTLSSCIRATRAMLWGQLKANFS